MSINDIILAIRIVVCVFGLWWSVRVLVHRIQGELYRQEQHQNGAMKIISIGSLLRAAIALVVIGTLSVTTALIQWWPWLMAELVTSIGLFYLVSVVAWSVVEERTQHALDHLNYPAVRARPDRALRLATSAAATMVSVAAVEAAAAVQTAAVEAAIVLRTAAKTASKLIDDAAREKP